MRFWLPKAWERTSLEEALPALPAAVEPAASAWTPKLVRPVLSPKGELPTILIVDDEIIIATSTALALNEAGFATVIAGTGERARQVLTSGPAIDLLFTDLILPQGPNGLDLARHARERQPDIRVVIASGHITKAISRLGEDEDYATISKPYSGEQAVAAVTAALAGDAAADPVQANRLR